MSYGFRCPKTGLFEWVDAPGLQRCPQCGGRHPAESVGAPPPQGGWPNLIPDRIPKYFDYGIGDWIDSRSRRNDLCRQHGLNLNSAEEHWRHHGSGLKSDRKGHIRGSRGQKLQVT